MADYLITTTDMTRLYVKWLVLILQTRLDNHDLLTTTCIAFESVQ